MFTRMILFVFVIFALAGCATGPQKQVAYSVPVVPEKSQKTYQQESYSKDYDGKDVWSRDNYEKSAKQAYSDSVTELSPKQIQQALKKAGFYKGGVDGKIGPKTRAAIIKFQQARGLRDDGVVGKRTMEELRKYF